MAPVARGGAPALGLRHALVKRLALLVPFRALRLEGVKLLGEILPGRLRGPERRLQNLVFLCGIHRLFFRCSRLRRARSLGAWFRGNRLVERGHVIVERNPRAVANLSAGQRGIHAGHATSSEVVRFSNRHVQADAGARSQPDVGLEQQLTT